MRREFAYVYQPFLAGKDLNHGSEIQYSRHLAGIYIAYLGLTGQIFHHLDRTACGLLICRANHDTAIALDVDGGLGLLDNGSDIPSSGSYQCPDLVDIDLQFQNPRRKGA